MLCYGNLALERFQLVRSRLQTRPDPANAKEYQLHDQVGFILRQVSQRHLAIFVNQIEDFTPMQFAALAKLCERRSLSQNELGRQTAMDGATIKGVVDRLKNRGYVNTESDPQDQRRIILSPSSEGDRIFDLSVAAARQITEDTLAPLSDKEQTQFMGLLSRLR